MTDVRPLRWLRRQDLVGAWRAAFTTTIGIVLLLPVASAVLFGISLHGHFEESIGYRYFNSLRIVYGSEHPWIPQGHFPGLVHELIQIALSAAGWDLDDLGSRVDIFSYAAIAVPLGFTPLAFLWASRPIRSTPLLFLLCTSFLIVVIANPYPWLLAPDYHAWIPALALVAVGGLIRLSRGLSRRTTREVLLCAGVLGAFGGISLGIKVTLIVFPLAVILGCCYARRDGLAKNVSVLALAAIVTVATWLLVLIAYHLGNYSAVGEFFRGLLLFTRSHRQTLNVVDSPFHGWLVDVVNAPWTIKMLPLLTPPAVLLGLLQRQTRPIAFALMLPCVLSLYVLYERPSGATEAEAIMFAWVTLVALVVGPFMSNPKRQVSRRWAIAAGLAMPLLVGASVIDAWPRYEGSLVWNKECSDAAVAMQDTVKRIGQRIAYLSADNTYRLPSVDGALCKGGSEIFHPERGLSAFMRQLFPGRWCGQVPSKVDVADFEGIVFFRLEQETLGKAIGRIESAFQSPLAELSCADEFPARGSSFVVCRR